MFRTFVISRLTQSSTWYGLIIVLVAFLLPRNWIVFAGILIAVSDDTKVQAFFNGMRREIELWWKP